MTAGPVILPVRFVVAFLQSLLRPTAAVGATEADPDRPGAAPEDVKLTRAPVGGSVEAQHVTEDVRLATTKVELADRAPDPPVSQLQQSLVTPGLGEPHVGPGPAVILALVTPVLALSHGVAQPGCGDALA